MFREAHKNNTHTGDGHFHIYVGYRNENIVIYIFHINVLCLSNPTKRHAGEIFYFIFCIYQMHKDRNPT